MVKNPPAMQETWFRSLGQEDLLEKGMVTHSSILVWRIPWTLGPWGCKELDLIEQQTNIQARTHTSIIIATSGSREPGLPRAASFSAIPHPLMCCVGVPVPALNSSISLSAMDMHLAASHFHPKASPRQAVYKNSLSCFYADGIFYMRNNPADSILHSLNKNELACGLVGIWIRNELCCQKKSLLKMGVCELLVLCSKY